ncbi:MAG: helix-turn-helix transcriptional regulator [Selenomonadaceae bacterium]|nr:helix-turn-helix transcriptional regulator [Selenomonadaceae bacterium]
MYTFNITVTVDDEGRQLERHGTAAFPVVCNQGDLNGPEHYSVMCHWHDSFEIIFAHQGSIVVGADNSIETLNEGAGCFINAGVLHSVRAASTDESVLRSIVFHPRVIGGIDTIFWQKYSRPLIENRNCRFICFNVESERDREIIELMRDAWLAELEEAPGFEFEVRSLLSRLIFKIIEGAAGNEYTLTEGELRDLDRLKTMITFIENNFADNITLKQIAETSSISEGECIRCFKRTTALPPMQFLKEFRLLRASELLRTTRLKIADIAERCGFLDMSYFAKSFKQLMSESPTDYRKNNLHQIIQQE